MIRKWVSVDAKILEKLMKVQWESRGFDHELKLNLNQLTTRKSEHNGVDLVIPGTLTDDDDVIQIKWILTAAIEPNDAGEVYASYPVSYSSIEYEAEG